MDTVLICDISEVRLGVENTTLNFSIIEQFEKVFFNIFLIIVFHR